MGRGESGLVDAACTNEQIAFRDGTPEPADSKVAPGRKTPPGESHAAFAGNSPLPERCCWYRSGKRHSNHQQEHQERDHPARGLERVNPECPARTTGPSGHPGAPWTNETVRIARALRMCSPIASLSSSHSSQPVSRWRPQRRPTQGGRRGDTLVESRSTACFWAAPVRP